MAELFPGSSAPRPPRTHRLRAAILLLTVSLFGCDHATRLAAEQSLSNLHGQSNGRAVDLVSGVLERRSSGASWGHESGTLELRFAANDDTAFSLFHDLGLARPQGILVVAATLALLAVVAMWLAVRKRATRMQHIGFALVGAGALGNVVDRAMRGYVVDFIHLSRWPIFNVADVAVVVGAILLALAALASRSRPASPPLAPASPS